MMPQTFSDDGYARLMTYGLDVLTLPGEGGLLFVDLALGATDGFERVKDAWRGLPPSVIGMCSQIVVRSPVVRFDGEIDGIDPEDELRMLWTPDDWPDGPDELAEKIATLLEDGHLPQRDVRAFELPVNGEPRVSKNMTSELLARCRAVELESLLRNRNAIWEPDTYHYRLPSGDHANSFVRIADAFTDRRAAPALASWLRGALTESSVLVIDSGTLIPMVDQLELWIERAAAKLPLPAAGLLGLEALDHYPRSRFQYQRQFKDVSDAGVLAVLSVSSSGRTYQLLGQSLNDTASNWRAECLVTRDKLQGAQALPPVDGSGLQDAWLSIPASTSKDMAACKLCRDRDRARVVRINPRNFGAMVLPAPVHVMPDILAAARNASLFQGYNVEIDKSTAIQLAPTESSRLRAQPRQREVEPSRVRFDPLTLLLGDGSTDRVAARVEELRNLPPNDPAAELVAKALDRLKEGNPTVVVCDDQEVHVLAGLLTLEAEQSNDSLGQDEARDKAERLFLAVAKTVCPTVDELVVAKRDDDLSEQLQDHTHLLLLVAGLQTGVTLQHLVVQVQDAVEADPKIHGLVLHAHPDSSSAWNSVRNTFRIQRDPSVVALWLTFVPSESPFVAEHDVLASVQDAWFKNARFGARERFDERLAWVQSNSAATTPAPHPPSPLWSLVPMKLRRTSRYGTLDDRRCVAAVGAALGESLDRNASDSAPEWVQVDLLNAFRSYFDGILHASLLRWVSPSRTWWGTDNECVSVIDELHGRFNKTDDWTLLLAELLLACAQGKLPDEGMNAVMGHAQEALDDAEETKPNEPHPLGFVELGLILAERSLVEDPESTADASDKS